MTGTLPSEAARTSQAPGALRSPGRNRRRVVIAGIGAAALAASGGFLLATHGQGGPSAAGAPKALPMVPVAFGNLTAYVQVNGSLGHAGAFSLIGEQAGVLTRAPAVGQVIHRGRAVYWLGQRPIPLMYGTVPFYRQLTVGSTGPDVRQLNRNLAALDYADGLSLDPAGTYTAATALAVERWQEALGVSVTGVFGAGDAVVAPGPIRVTSVTPLAGQQVSPGQVLLTATGVARQVHVNLDVTEQTYAHKGELVRIQLPSGGTVTGRIASVGHVASSASGSNTNGTAGQAGGSTSGQTIPVNISILGSTAALGGLDQAPVTVDLVQETLHGVLTVPIDALQAEPGGGSAVTTVGTHGQRRLVRVKAGLFASGRVQISGPGITAGTKVEVASL